MRPFTGAIAGAGVSASAKLANPAVETTPEPIVPAAPTAPKAPCTNSRRPIAPEFMPPIQRRPGLRGNPENLHRMIKPNTPNSPGSSTTAAAPQGEYYAANTTRPVPRGQHHGDGPLGDRSLPRRSSGYIQGSRNKLSLT